MKHTDNVNFIYIDKPVWSISILYFNAFYNGVKSLKQMKNKEKPRSRQP